MGENQEENAIVTSTGEYVVAWDFNKVKKGLLDKYHIKKCVFSLALPPLSTFYASRPLCSWFLHTFTGTKIVWSKITSNSEMTRKSYVWIQLRGLRKRPSGRYLNALTRFTFDRSWLCRTTF
jgi:hypothetical protein